MAAPYEELPESEVLKHAVDLRTAFFTQHGDATPKKYDSQDLDRARQSDTWLRHFLLHQKYIIPNAVKMMDAVLTWRKDFGVNNVREDMIPLHVREIGAVYFHNKSLNQNDIITFVIKLNKKGDEEYMKASRNMIVYLLDQYQRRNPLRKIVALLDMTGVGLSNVDIGLTKFLISCFTTYFPGMLDMLLVYDMPWIVNSVWSLVKVMLSEEEQKHVVFCKKNSIQQHIEKSQLLPHMGGTDNFIYRYSEPVFEDEDDNGAFQETEDHHDDNGSGGDNTEANTSSTSNGTVTSSLPDIAQQVPAAADRPTTTKKHVNWAAKDDVKEFTPPSSPKPSTLDVTSTSGSGGAEVATSSQAVGRTDSVDSGSVSPTKPTAYRITIIPKSELQFSRPGINQEASCSIKLTNEQTITLAYKVRTTDPKNYRVKQGRGMLQPNQSETVHITLLAGKEIKRDKFLVLSTKLNSDDVTASELSALWKNTSKAQIHEHKLRCHEAVQLDLDDTDTPANTSTLNNTSSSVSYTSVLSKSSSAARQVPQTEAKLEKLQADVNQIKLLLKILVSLLVLVIGLLLAR